VAPYHELACLALKESLVVVDLNGRVALPHPGDAVLQDLVGALRYCHLLSEAGSPHGVVTEPEFLLLLPRPLRNVLQFGSDLCGHLFSGHRPALHRGTENVYGWIPS